MEPAISPLMLGISVRDRFGNTEIRRRTNPKNHNQGVTLAENRNGQICRRQGQSSGRRVLEQRPRESYRSVGNQ